MWFEILIAIGGLLLIFVAGTQVSVTTLRWIPDTLHPTYVELEKYFAHRIDSGYKPDTKQHTKSIKLSLYHYIKYKIWVRKKKIDTTKVWTW